MEELLKAVTADFEGYEDIRHMCINVPKYGNDIDEVDMLTSKALQDCAEYCATLKCGRAGNYYLQAFSQQQTNVAMGEMWLGIAIRTKSSDTACRYFICRTAYGRQRPARSTSFLWKDQPQCMYKRNHSEYVDQ